MSTPYFEFSNPVVAGTTVRSDKYNTDFQAVQSGFEAVKTHTEKSIKMPAGYSGQMTLPEFTGADSLVRLNANGTWGYYPMATFTGNVANVQIWRDETLVFRNEAEASATAAAGYAATVGVPIVVVDGGSFTIPENQPAIEIVCLGSAAITFPATPFPDAKYVVKSTDKNGVVTITLGAGHQITDNAGVLQPSAIIEGLYQLDIHWLGAGAYRGF